MNARAARARCPVALYIVTEISARGDTELQLPGSGFSELTAQEAPTRRFMVATNVIRTTCWWRLRGGVRRAAATAPPAPPRHAGRVAALGVGRLSSDATRERLAAARRGPQRGPVATGCEPCVVRRWARSAARRRFRPTYGTSRLSSRVVVAAGRQDGQERRPVDGWSASTSTPPCSGSRRWLVLRETRGRRGGARPGRATGYGGGQCSETRCGRPASQALML